MTGAAYIDMSSRSDAIINQARVGGNFICNNNLIKSSDYKLINDDKGVKYLLLNNGETIRTSNCSLTQN
jgi:hypothetical protein